MSQPEILVVVYYNAKTYKTHVGKYVKYVVDMGSSDYRLGAMGLQRVREFMLWVQSQMRDGLFYVLAPSYIELTIHNEVADAAIEYLALLLCEPHVLQRLPITEEEVSMYMDHLCSIMEHTYRNRMKVMT
jgi:hypothetical protein